MRSYGDTCPIAAPASQGALALIRTSGEDSVKLLSAVFSRPQKLLDAPGNTVVYGWMEAPGKTNTAAKTKTRIDEVLVSVYRAPFSYTGEEGADISCHGGNAAVLAVMETLRCAGFHDALPGEFSFRAFINGKIDLTRAESVAELLAAKSRGGLERAVRRLSGALRDEIETIRQKLVETAAAVELFLDYSEDEADEAAARGLLPRREAAEEALERLRFLVRTYRHEQLYREGALAVIAGRPNAGKSSLFNALLGEDRSIVTALPGTTRDWIEASISLDGIPLRLADTAGLREKGSGEAESLGIGRSRELLKEADIVLYVIDGSLGITGADKAFVDSFCTDSQVPVLFVWNKADVRQIPPGEQLHTREKLIAVSAKNGMGFAELHNAVKKTLNGSFGAEESFFNAGLGAQRQKELAEKAVLSLEEALSMADREEPLDLIAPFLRETLNVLGEITGETAAPDLLEEMFSRFCLGK